MDLLVTNVNWLEETCEKKDLYLPVKEDASFSWRNKKFNFSRQDNLNSNPVRDYMILYYNICFTVNTRVKGTKRTCSS